VSDEEITPELSQEVIDQVVSGLIPATAAQVGVAMGHLSRRLGDVNRKITAQRKLVTKLTKDYKLATDLTLVRLTNPTDGEQKFSVEAAKAKARIDHYELGLELEMAKDEMRRLKDEFQEIKERIKVGQTNAATVRSEHRNIGYGGGV
jgi:hypothetical protein